MKTMTMQVAPAQKWFTILMMCALLVGSCAAPAGSAGGLVDGGSEHEAAPAVPPEDVAVLAAGNRAFAVDLYQAIRGENGNLCFSPYSISEALGMTYAGARGATEQQMAAALHFGLPHARLHPAFHALDEALASRGESGTKQPGSGGPSKAVELDIANALWVQDGLRIEQAFLDTLATNYGSGLRFVDFGESEVSRQTINAWVRDETRKRIEELLPKGAISSDTALVLANAIYFDGAWRYEFDRSATVDGPFTRLDGSQVTTPMMKSGVDYPRAVGSGYVAVELPYSDDATSMVIVMPDPGTFEAFEAQLTGEELDAIMAELRLGKTNLVLPKFEIKGATVSLAKAMQSLGMKAAFDPTAADFSGIIADRSGAPLWIGDVFHQAYIAVDEAGTEAGAATAVVTRRTSYEPIETITIDHPFFFLIRDRETGSVLFMGRVLDPTS